MDVRIGLNNRFSIPKECIKEYLPNRKVKIIKEDHGGGYILEIEPKENEHLSKSEKYKDISNMLVSLIENKYLKDLVKKRINIIASNLDIRERKEVVKISQEILLDKEKYVNEKEYFKNEIEKYIVETSFIMLDGFIRFRIREINIFVDKIIKVAIEKLKLEKEYDEFINVLQYFVESQKPKCHEINIRLKNNDYKLFDGKGNVINKTFFKEIVSEIDNGNISGEDLLVGALIVIAPERINLYLGEEYREREEVKTIKKIFEGKVYFYSNSLNICES